MQSIDISSSQFQNSEMIQFPQPTRPINSYNFETPQRPPELVNTSYVNFESSQDNFEAPTTAGPEEEKETLDEILKLVSEWYEKLPASMRSKLNLRMLNGPSNKPKGFKVNSSTSTRGVDGLLEEMTPKLERFKIRTVQQGGVVQEDDQEEKP